MLYVVKQLCFFFATCLMMSKTNFFSKEDKQMLLECSNLSISHEVRGALVEPRGQGQRCRPHGDLR